MQQVSSKRVKKVLFKGKMISFIYLHFKCVINVSLYGSVMSMVRNLRKELCRLNNSQGSKKR